MTVLDFKMYKRKNDRPWPGKLEGDRNSTIRVIKLYDITAKVSSRTAPGRNS